MADLYSFGTAPQSKACADCAHFVRFESVDGVPQPIDGRWDGDDVVHDACYNVRCAECGASAAFAFRTVLPVAA